MSSESAVLVLHSSCFHDDTALMGSSLNATHDGRRIQNDKRIIQELQNLSISCDVIILPEFPDGSANSAKGRSLPKLQTSKETLLPCGMDNVLLFADIPLSSDRFLLSVASCHIEEQLYSQAGGGDFFPVSAIPSTFSFHLDSGKLISFDPSMKSSEEFYTPLAELDIVFDYTQAYRYSQLHTQQDARKDDEAPAENEERAPEVEEEDLNKTPICQAVLDDPPRSRHDVHDFFRLQDLAAKELDGLNTILAGMAIISALLLAILIFAVFYLARSAWKIRSRSSASYMRANDRSDVAELGISSERAQMNPKTKYETPPGMVIPILKHRPNKNELPYSPIPASIEKRFLPPKGLGDQFRNADEKNPGILMHIPDIPHESISCGVNSAGIIDDHDAGNLSPLSIFEKRWNQTKTIRRCNRRVKKTQAGGPSKRLMMAPVSPTSPTKDLAHVVGGCENTSSTFSPDEAPNDSVRAELPDRDKSFVLDHWGV